MHVNGKQYRAVWMENSSVFMVEQNILPFDFQIFEAKTYRDTCMAIITMITRGAGSIGASAGFAMSQAFLEAPKDGFDNFVVQAKNEIEATRPTAQNLFYATNRVFLAGKVSIENAVKEAHTIADECVNDGRMIGEFGKILIKNGANVQTHCNAGWLGLVEYGSALAPIYLANLEGKKIHVWVDETRPRSQGARLTAWELHNENIDHTIVPDNAGAFLMEKGKVDIMIVGADRIAANGDTANKIGTLEKAIVAKHFGVPFYVAAPTSTIDMNCDTGENIPIEERSPDELFFQKGMDELGNIKNVRLSSPGSQAFNPAFDVTPASLITGIITEKGIVKPTVEEVASLF